MVVILISITNFSYGIILAILLIIIIRFSNLSSTKEGFNWGTKKINDFLKVQESVNPNTVFLIDEVTKQATKKEVDYYLINGFWPWDKEVELLYMESSLNNPFIQTHPEDSLRDIKKKYNQKVILQLLANETKEGIFMLKGLEVPTGKNNIPDGTGFFGYNDGLITNLYNKNIKCFPKNKHSKKYVLKSLEYKGDDGILGSQILEKKNIDINDLENIIPGFTFLKGPCNPCAAMAFDNNPSYHCPFSLKLKNDNDVSEVWKYLWKLGDLKLSEKNLYSKKELQYDIDSNAFKQPPFNT